MALDEALGRGVEIEIDVLPGGRHVGRWAKWWRQTKCGRNSFIHGVLSASFDAIADHFELELGDPRFRRC